MMEQSQLLINPQTILIPPLFSLESISPKKPDLDAEFFVHRAKTQDDFRKVFDIRWEGYKKYFKNKDEVVDDLDFSQKCILLLAEDEYHNAVGTLRILDRRFGKVELDNFVDVDSFLSEDERGCIEATRFSIPCHPNAKSIKHLLWKALLLYCLTTHVNVVIYSVRPCAARLYRRLLFENVGPYGVYNHPSFGNLEHHTYKFIINKKREVLKKKYHKLYDFLFEEDHPNIILN